MNIFNDLKSKIDPNEMTRISKSLHDNYQPFLLDCQVWDLIEKVVPREIYNDYLKQLRKNIVGHKIINDLVMNTYFGERKVKYHLSLRHLGREDEVSVFEFNVGSSRLDYARINGSSYAYEIKTELDSLEKLEKQIYDYSKAFEYIHVVCHPTHYLKVLEKVPSYCGIITYTSDKEGLPFSFKRKRTLNLEIDSKYQLSSLTIKELEKILKLEGLNTLLTDREEREELLLLKLTSKKINHHFKETVKRRFRKKWQFIVDNADKIQPIDYQSFFKSSADPHWVYYKNSSMV